MAAVFAIIVLFGTRGVYAWGKTWMGLELQRAVTSAKWKLGPFRISPVLYLTDLGYDTNLFYGYGGNPVKDYTVTGGPGFSAYLPIKKKIIFQIYESPQYVYCYRTKSERTWNYYFSAKVSFDLNRFFISVGKGITDAKQRWSTEIDIRPRLMQDSWEGSILFQATKKTSFFVRDTQTTYKYENLAFGTFNIRDRLNRREDRLSFRAYYQATRRARFFLEGEYARFNFLQVVSQNRNSRSYGYFGGFEFAPLGIIRGRIGLGYKILEPQGKDFAGFKGLCGDSNVSVRLLRFLTVRGSYSRDIQLSVWYNNAYYLETRSGGGVSIYFIKKIRIDYDYRVGKNRYPESQLVSPGTTVKRRDDYGIHSVGLYFRLKNNIGIGLVANRWKRDSNLMLENANRDFIGMNLTYEF
jgi:hypothetical protein